MNQSMINSPLRSERTLYSVSTDFVRNSGKHLSVGDVLPIPHHLAAVPKLTSREVEVLLWSAEGKTAIDIARILSISQETIHSHVKSAVTKLQVANKTAAVARALRLGLMN